MRHDHLKARFAELSTQLKKETGHISNVSHIIRHPAYQEIASWGEPAIHHMLLDMLDNGPEHWFWALTSITGFNPITEDIAGHMQSMTDVWLVWGVANGYITDTTVDKRYTKKR